MTLFLVWCGGGGWREWGLQGLLLEPPLVFGKPRAGGTGRDGLGALGKEAWPSGRLLLYFQRPVTLAFPRVLETFWLSLILFRRTLISYFCCLNFSCRSNFSASRL